MWKTTKENLPGKLNVQDLNEEISLPAVKPKSYKEQDFLIKLKYMDEEEYENIDKLYTSLFFTCQEDEGGWANDLRAAVDARHPEGVTRGGGDPNDITPREPPKGVPDSIEIINVDSKFNLQENIKSFVSVSKSKIFF